MPTSDNSSIAAKLTEIVIATGTAPADVLSIYRQIRDDLDAERPQRDLPVRNGPPPKKKATKRR